MENDKEQENPEVQETPEQTTPTECQCKKRRLFCDRELEIPLVTVENKSGISNLANCLVHISDINTTMYIDRRHRIATVYAGIVEGENYDIEKNPLGLANQLLFNREANKENGEISESMYYFDKQGKPHKI